MNTVDSLIAKLYVIYKLSDDDVMDVANFDDDRTTTGCSPLKALDMVAPRIALIPLRQLPRRTLPLIRVCTNHSYVITRNHSHLRSSFVIFEIRYRRFSLTDYYPEASSSSAPQKEGDDGQLAPLHKEGCPKCGKKVYFNEKTIFESKEWHQKYVLT